MTLAEKRAELARLQAEVTAEETAARARIAEGNLWGVLAAFGVGFAVTEYDGHGDDGEVHTVSFYMSEDGPEISVPDGLRERLIDFTQDALSGAGHDWYNNEGGWGTCSFRVAERVASFDHHQRREASDDFAWTAS